MSTFVLTQTKQEKQKPAFRFITGFKWAKKADCGYGIFAFG